MKPLTEQLFRMRRCDMLPLVYRNRGKVSKAEFAEALIEAWTSSERPHEVYSVRTLVSLFRSVPKEYLMNDSERDVLESLPQEVTVFRGVGSENNTNIRMLSWSLDIEKAAWFAARFEPSGGTVYAAEIPKEHIFCFCNCRKEKEIIVNPKYLMNIRQVEK